MSRRILPLVVLPFVFYCLAIPASACEPVVPFITVMVGPGAILQSFIGLGVAVLVKSLLFAAFQKRLRFGMAFLLMILGNGLSTVVGVVAAAMIGSSGELWIVGAVIVFGFCLLPAKRLIHGDLTKWLSHWSPAKLAAAMTGMLMLSCFLFGIAGWGIGDGRKMEYWLLKLAAVYLALLVSIGLTVYWEEWVIWRLSASKDTEFYFLKPVLRANLLVLLVVMGIGAAIMLPKRLKTPDHLIDPRAATHQSELAGNNL